MDYIGDNNTFIIPVDLPIENSVLQLKCLNPDSSFYLPSSDDNNSELPNAQVNSLPVLIVGDVPSILVADDDDAQPKIPETVYEIVPEGLNLSFVQGEQVELEEEPITVDDEIEREDENAATVFMCGGCSLVFSSASQIQNHINIHHKKPGRKRKSRLQQKKSKAKKIEIDSSTLPVDSEESSLQPLIEGNPEINACNASEDKDEHGCPDLIVERPFKCTVVGCGAKFTDSEWLSKHSECHRTEGDSAGILHCSQCHYTASKWPTLASHLWRSHALDINMYKCSVCKYRSGMRLHLLHHYRAHCEGGGEYLCRHCGRLYKEAQQLAEHVAEIHSSVPVASFPASMLNVPLAAEPLPNRTDHGSAAAGQNSTSPVSSRIPQVGIVSRKSGTTKVCHECGQELANARSLRKHIKCVHGAVRPYVCSVCGYSAKTKHTLKLHMRQHSYDKPFSCDSCPFKSRDHNTMRRHKMRHSGQRPYACPHCPYAATQSTTLVNHITWCHPGLGGVYQCSSCSFTTINPALLDNHSRIKHREGRSNQSHKDEQDRNFSSMFPSSKNASELVRNYPSGIEDDESSSQCYFDSDHIDTGGITIPAEDPKEGNFTQREEPG